jgi:YHS domain-containing protein
MSTLLKYFNSILTQQKRPESPIPDAFPPPTGPQPRWIDCGNMACIEYISDPTEWKQVSYKKSDLYFCSEECWNEWLNTPSHLGCYSPPPSKND